MKKRYLLAVLFLLVGLMAAGCRGRGNGYDTPSTTTTPTAETTTPVMPSTAMTEAPSTQPTVDNGNGPLESGGETGESSGSESTPGTQEPSSRSRIPQAGTNGTGQLPGTGR